MGFKIPIYRYGISSNIEFADFKSTCTKLLRQAVRDNETIVRAVFFGSPTDNKSYMDELSVISDVVCSVFEDKKPVFSYVAQRPLEGGVVLEVAALANPKDVEVSYKRESDIDYIVIKGDRYREVLLGGVASNPVERTIAEQCTDVFAKIDKVFEKEKIDPANIVRQWNYIERITDFEGEHQNYQLFNDARSLFYNKTKWDKGYPAATGIGMQLGGIIVDLNVVDGELSEFYSIDNPLQIAAHDYSQNVLLGAENQFFKTRTTPKFERAKIIVTPVCDTVYISGTAAIRGEESVVSNDVIKQTETTMDNINHLVSAKNIASYAVKEKTESPYLEVFRVYIKNPEDSDVVKKYMSTHYNSVEICYLHADICRDELLIEIEGVAHYQH